MDIIERYLEAVAAQLPAAEREDIVAELRDLILSRVEAREEELGRALDDAEKEAILHEIGHPLVVAARYRKGPDSLIGPELFPYWLFGMKAGLIVIAAIQALGLVFNLIGDPTNFGQFVGRAFQGFISSGLTVAGALTIAGAVMEHYGLKPGWLTKWRMKDLPAFGLADPAAWGAALGGSEKSKADWLPKGGRAWGLTANSSATSNALWSLIGGGVFVLWWIGALRFPGWGDFALRDGTVDILAAPIWAVLFAPILAWACAGIAVDAMTLMRPGARRLAAFLKIPVAAAGLWIGWRLFEAGHWLTLTQGEQTARVTGSAPELLNFDALRAIHDAGSGLADTAMTLSTVLSWVLAAIMIGLVVEILTQMWRITTMKDC